MRAEYSTLSPYSSSLPASTLSPLAFLFLTAAFVLSQYFSTLPAKGVPTTELAVGGASAVLAGFGLVFAFCAVGVNV
ncbi:hypothetical protein RQP46_011214 [Phenoliferia psychrophenolica]